MILVTGATGFLGSHLLLHLLDHNQTDVKVVALHRTETSPNLVATFFEMHQKSHLFKKIIWTKADILDIPSLEIAFENISIVYHCAAIVSFEPNDEELLRKNNIEGTANVVNCCLDFGIKKFCYVSSIAALGDLLPNQLFINEQTDWNAELEHSNYAISKFGAEMEVWRAHQEGLDIIIVNPGVILGNTVAQNWETGSSKIIATVAKGLRFYTNGTTGFVAATDVVKAMRLLMESEIVNQKFVLVSENCSYENLTTKIAAKLGVAAPKHEIKEWQSSICWRLDWLFSKLFFRKRLLSKSIAKSLHSKDLYDASKIKKLLDFEFESFEKTINETTFCYLNR